MITRTQVKIFIFSLGLFIFVFPFCFSAETFTGARFLKLGAGARELAMGSAASAVSNDVNAIYWNPAGLSRMSHSQLSFTHAEWLLDTRYDFVGFGVPTSKGAFGFSGTYLFQGQQEGRTENREKTGDFSLVDTALSLAYARNLGAKLNLGTGVKFIQSRIADDQANGVALDVGSQYRLTPATQLGLSIRNIGPPIGFLNQKDPLPLLFALGVGREIFLGMNLVGEWQVEPHDRKNQFILGTEYRLASVSLRAGYLSGLK